MSYDEDIMNNTINGRDSKNGGDTRKEKDRSGFSFV